MAERHTCGFAVYCKFHPKVPQSTCRLPLTSFCSPFSWSTLTSSFFSEEPLKKPNMTGVRSEVRGQTGHF